MLWGTLGLILAGVTVFGHDLPRYRGTAAPNDWLVDGRGAEAGAYTTERPNELVLSNGLVSRTFLLSPNAATIGMEELTQGAELVRAASPEAVLTLDGKTYDVGGLSGQPDLAYLRSDWIGLLRGESGAFQCTGYDLGKPEARLDWKATRPHEADAWPPRGVRLTLHFMAPRGEEAGVRCDVIYELYDGMPVISKKLRVFNESGRPVHVDSFALERLRTAEPESIVEDSSDWLLPNLTVLTDYTFGGGVPNDLNRTVYWDKDPAYGTQVNYSLGMPCVLRIAPPLGPAQDVPPGQTFQSYTAFTIVHDSWDRERRGLAIRKAYRRLAPWITENPIMLHLTSTDPATVKTAIDQAADAGFEMVIFSFGSGLNMEDVSAANIAKYKGFADYAHSKGIQVGGYSLLASRHISEQDDVVDPKTGKIGHAVFGDSPCLCSQWAETYFQHLRTFLSETGFDLLEHDGSYPGDVCASTSHPGHKGLLDSQWNQFQVIARFYAWCRERGIFLNVPDNYMLSGSNKTGMGYREDNWSLPRAQQQIHARQNLYDGTWLKPPSMGWMFVPLVEYHGGGAAATIEPLKEHLRDYEMELVANFGYGAQACYRGPRIYDAPETRTMVKKWVGWFKAHRGILESDVIHLRRPDGRHLDAILHVNPTLSEKGMLMVWNPSDRLVEENLKVPLYYTGLKEAATLSGEGGVTSKVKLDRNYSAIVRVSVAPGSFQWLSIR